MSEQATNLPPSIDPEAEREWERLDSQGQFTHRQIRDAAGMTHSSEDVERRETAKVKGSQTSSKRASRRRTYHGAQATNADNDRAVQTEREIEAGASALRREPITDEEKTYGFSAAQRIMEQTLEDHSQRD